MINEVTITVTFTTGTTIQDQKQAAAYCENLLIKQLRQKGIAGWNTTSFLFNIQHVKSKAKKA